MKIKLLAIIFLFGMMPSFGQEKQIGDINKIYYYDSINDFTAAKSQLQKINKLTISQQYFHEVENNLLDLGQYFFQRQNFQMAELCYHKISDIFPNSWTIYNNLVKIEEHQNNNYFVKLLYVMKQIDSLLRNFKGAFILITEAINIAYFTILLVFFVFSILLFSRYFKLIIHDFIGHNTDKFIFLKTALKCILIIWPVFIGSGWAIYPFLICGFLWSYLNEIEKSTLKLHITLIAILTIFYSFSNIYGHSVNTTSFKNILYLYEGRIIADDAYASLDDELKMIQAYNLYKKNQKESALEILVSLNTSYHSAFKSNLLGVILFESNKIDKCIQHFRDALTINDHDPVALNNFAIALSKSNDQSVFNSYIKRYPELDKIKKEMLVLQIPALNDILLWKRLFNFPMIKTSILAKIIILLSELIKSPFLIYLILLVGYIILMKRIFPTTGDSIYCAKCNIIIKKPKSDRTYVLCNECYQLFLLKDPIFLDAKIIKEKEIERSLSKKFIFTLILSLIIPGIRYYFRGKGKTYTFISFFFFLCLLSPIFISNTFKTYYNVSPLFLFIVLFIGMLIYFLANIFSLMGDDYGV